MRKIFVVINKRKWPQKRHKRAINIINNNMNDDVHAWTDLATHNRSGNFT